MTKTLQSNQQSELDAESVLVRCESFVTMPVRSIYKPLRLPKRASRRCESSQWLRTPVARCVLVAGLTLWLWT